MSIKRSNQEIVKQGTLFDKQFNSKEGEVSFVEQNFLQKHFPKRILNLR